MYKAEELIGKVKDAECVLIGIGEEFNEEFTQIGLHADLVKLLNQIDGKEELDWIIPFLEKKYLEEEAYSENLSAYQKLYDLVKDKNYFIVSTCIDGMIEKVGFDKEKIVQPCGNYHFLQCSRKCDHSLYEVETYLETVISNMKQEKYDVPVCPNCGAPLVFNQVTQGNYVEEGYLPQWEKYTKWLSATLNRKLCILELGVGMDFPTVIRSPFEKVGFFNMKASFFRINENHSEIPEDMGEKGISIQMNAKLFLNEKI